MSIRTVCCARRGACTISWRKRPITAAEHRPGHPLASQESPDAPAPANPLRSDAPPSWAACEGPTMSATEVAADLLALQRLYHWERTAPDRVVLTQPMGGGELREFT